MACLSHEFCVSRLCIGYLKRWSDVGETDFLIAGILEKSFHMTIVLRLDKRFAINYFT